MARTGRIAGPRIQPQIEVFAAYFEKLWTAAASLS